MSYPDRSRPLHYKLVGRRAVPCQSLEEWSAWYSVAHAGPECRVDETCIDDVRISTVFLSLDHNPFAEGDPALFETMVFVAGETHHVRRYFIWDEAAAGHAEMVALIREEMEAAEAKAASAWALVSSRLIPGS